MDAANHTKREWFQKRTFADVLQETAERLPGRVALNYRHRSWTFGEVESEVDRLARGLLGVGVEPGDIVLLWLHNRPEWILFFFALTKVGAVVAPLNTAFRARELRTILEHAEAKWLVLAARSGPISYIEIARSVLPPDAGGGGVTEAFGGTFPKMILLDEAAEAAMTIADVIAAGEDVGVDDVRKRAEALNPDDLALLLYTSGSTGVPKGVMLNHNAIRNVTDQANRLGVREHDVILAYLPLFHALGLYEGPLLSVVAGARMVLLDRFEPGVVLRAIATEHVTMCFGFSTHYHDMLNHPDFHLTDISSLRTGILAAGPRSVEPVARRAQEAFGERFVSAWGLTEVGAGATLGFLDDDLEHRVASSGYPSPGYEVRVVDPATGNEQPRGTAGEVWVRTYQMTLGYFRAPEKTRQTINREGWLRTGDMGLHTDGGYLRILGRYKDVLKVGGENVDPSEVEEIFLDLPSVSAAIAVGVPNERLGEVVCLCVVPTAAAQAGRDLEQELHAVARRELAHFKRPRSVVFLDALPLTEAGKVHRERTRELALTRLGEG